MDSARNLSFMNNLNEIESGDNATEPQSPYSAFKLFVNEKMMRNIQQCNEMEVQMHSEGWKFSINDLAIARGVLSKGNAPRRSLWSNEWGMSFFKASIGRNFFEKILRHVCFDKQSSRVDRLTTNLHLFLKYGMNS